MRLKSIYSINDSFNILMILLIVVFLILLLYNPLGAQLNVFFARTADLFADFLNLQIYISDNDVYHNMYKGLSQKNYLPIAYMILALFSGFEQYSGKTLPDTYLSHPAIISCILFTLISVLLFFHSLSKLVKLDAKLIFIISFTSVFLFAIERCNLIMIAASMAFYYLAYKDSVYLKYRYFALTALCLSVVLKGYPIVLGLYLLQEKRFKDILFCIIITMLLTFLPFLFFKHGFDNIPQFLDNVMLNNQLMEKGTYPRFGLFVFNYYFFAALHAYNTIYSVVGFYIAKSSVIILSIVSILLFFKENEPWKKLMLISVIIAFLPSNNGFYCGLYFFPSLLLFLKDSDNDVKDYVYMLLFCLVLNPLQIVIYGYTITWLLSNFAAFVMWIMIIIENLTKLKGKHLFQCKGYELTKE